MKELYGFSEQALEHDLTSIIELLQSELDKDRGQLEDIKSEFMKENCEGRIIAYSHALWLLTAQKAYGKELK